MIELQLLAFLLRQGLDRNHVYIRSPKSTNGLLEVSSDFWGQRMSQVVNAVSVSSHDIDQGNSITVLESEEVEIDSIAAVLEGFESG